MESVQIGPYPLQISDGLDYYKATMSQVAHEKYPDAQVTFTFKNRGSERLLEYIEIPELQQRLDTIAKNGFSAEELEYLASQPSDQDSNLFSEDYLQSLDSKPLPPVSVCVNPETNDLHIETTGDWSHVTFWETIVMSEVNELYFENYATQNNLNMFDIYDEGDDRLTEKIQRLHNNSGIKIVDFGTRRHFSYRWQRHVVKRLAQECPENFIGSSNIGLAKDLGISPIGTFAHEMPMVYAALADEQGDSITESHGNMLDDWYEKYGNQLSIALTDTFGTSFFFADFGAERAVAWNGLRHDSGDPVVFGKQVLAFFEEHGIDPKTKTIVFSDGLDIDAIEMLYEKFSGKIGLSFGWGTTLTNDLGLKPLNHVMKATQANSKNTVKLSDTPGKHTGFHQDIERYQHDFAA